MLYKTQGTTPAGQVERFTLGGVLANTLEYDSERLLLTRVKTQKNGSTIQNFSYTYDGFCNLASRTDHMKSITETFGYDSQNRLTGVWLGATQTGASAYDGYGRMTSKTAGGQPVFSNAVYTTTAKPHAMDAATTAEGVFPATAQTVAYTSFDKVSKVKQGNDSLCYTYGYDHQRIFMEEHVGITSRTKRYVGNCEYITETNGNITDTQWLTYLSGPTGVYAVVMTKSGSDQIFFVLKDNLGSWTAITDENGTVEQRLSYDAWGNLRNPNTWSGSFNDMPLFDRGFTGHEHLHNFGLINMNGRMYDPLMSSFISVGRFVQNPQTAQGFNRYAYCLNNPLRYVDPSGWRAGGGNTGYFPNSSANAFDPYAFYGGHIPLEPRDICGIGVRTEVATALLATFMYGKKISVGGTVAFGDDGKICDIDLTLRFNINQLNQSLPAGVIGKCVLAGLGSTMKYWQDDKGGNWGDGTKQWLKKAEKYMEQTGNDFSDPKYLIDFIQWNDANAKNAFKSYEATFIPLSEVPKAISDGYVVAACSEIIREADIQINLGGKGHFANVSRIKVSNGSIELDFIEPEGTNIMNTFKSSSLFFYETPPYLYNISFVKYRLKP